MNLNNIPTNEGTFISFETERPTQSDVLIDDTKEPAQTVEKDEPGTDALDHVNARTRVLK